MLSLLYKKLVYKSLLTPQEVRERLAENVEPFVPLQLLWQKPATCYFRGEVTEQTFKLRKRPVKGKPNSRLVIKGTINPSSAGTHTYIEVMMRRTVALYLFLGIVLAGYAFITFTFLLISIKSGDYVMIGPQIAIFIGMIVLMKKVEDTYRDIDIILADIFKCESDSSRSHRREKRTRRD